MGNRPKLSPAKSPGSRFRSALRREKPLQIAGVIHAYAALLAQRAGFQALYLSGAGVANACHGLPDLGVTSRDDVVEEVRRITAVTDLPLLVDADTGWGGPREVALTIREMEKAGAAGVHIEDQISTKRCGHRPNKSVVPTSVMVARIKAAVNARRDPKFIIMARTDAVAVEGLDRGVERVCAYKAAGADMIFAEALGKLSEYQKFVKAMGIPVLANMTEFGVSPLFHTAQLAKAGIGMVLYPLSGFRAMNAAALRVYRTIRKKGTQRSEVRSMQTRRELYDILDYEKYERELDRKVNNDSK